MTSVQSRLTREHKHKLISLLGNVSLSLIYKASVHSYGANAFHGKCDRQGPTVTVAYNTSGFVFGGFTSKDFAQTGQNICDEKAFLFRLDGKNALQYRATNAQVALADGNTGPNFGGEMIFMNGDQAVVHSNPGDCYKFKAEEMHGNDVQLAECEVYRVEDLDTVTEKPWRLVDWRAEKRKALMDSVKNYKPVTDSVKEVRVLLIGPVGAGKSSFFNSINSVFRGHVTSQAIAGSAGASLTTQFRTYRIKAGRDGKTLPFILCDTMGLEEGPASGMNTDEIPNILKGHLPDRYQFNPTAHLNSEAHGFFKSPNLQDRIHCVAYVMDSCTVTLMSDKLKEKLAAIRNYVNQMGVSQLVLLTKVDEACPHVAEDLKKVYHSMYIKRKMQEASEVLGVPMSCVVPVKNYSQELEVELDCDILLLSAVVQMLRFIDNYLDDVCPNEESK